MLARLASNFMNSLMPSAPRMAASSAAYPSTAPWGDYWYQSMGLPNAQGVIGGDDAYEFVSTCFAATRLLCGIGAKMPLNRKQRMETSDGERSVVMRKDPVHRLINGRPNREQTAMAFRSMMVSWQVNRGTAFAEIERALPSGVPVAYWPIHPTRCRPFHSDEDGSLWWHVRNNNGYDTDIPDKNMLRIPYTVLDKSGLMGIGVSTRAAQTIGLAQSLDRTENDASLSGTPRIVVETPTKMNMPEQDAFRRQWRELYTQGGEAVAVLVGGATAKPLSWSAVDSDHVNRRDRNIEEIARWYDIPLTLLRRALKESAGNVEQLGQEFQTYSLAFLEMWEQELDYKCLTEVERETQCWELDYKCLLKADHVGRAQYMSSLFPIGGMNSNEVRDSEGWNPYPEGNKYFVQGAFRPIDEPYSANSPQTPPGNPKDGKANPLKGPSKKLAKQTAELKAATRVMLEDCVRRLTRKESREAVKAARKPREWFAWVESFYAEHEPWAATELKLPFEACAVFGIKSNPQVIAKAMCEQSKDALIAAADGDPDTFLDRVESMATEWEKTKPAEFVQSIKELQ